MACDSSNTLGWEDSCGRRCGHESAAQVVGPNANSFSGGNQRYHAFQAHSERLDGYAEMGIRPTSNE